MAPSRLESPPLESPALSSANKLENTKEIPKDNYGNYYPVVPATLNLESNYGPMSPESIGYLQPTSKDTPLEVMHERFERDGYLFVRSCVSLLSLAFLSRQANQN